MKLFVVWTILLVLGNLGANSLSLTGGAGSKVLPNDGATSSNLEKATVDPCRKVYEGVLKNLTKVSDLKSENLTETIPDNGTLTQTVEVKKFTDEKGNEINEKVVIKKEATVQPLTNATEAKPKDDKAATLLSPKVGADDQGKNKTETTFSASGNSDGPQKIERTEKTTDILPGNKTNEVVVTKKEEKLPSLETITETSKESKNVTDKGDGEDVEKETVIQKEVEKNVCNGDINKVRDERHLNETVEDLKHQVSDVKNMIKEEKAKAKETSATPTKCIVQKAIAAPAIQEGKVVKKVVPAVRPVKVVRKVVPAVRPVKVVRKVVPAVRPVKVVRQGVPSVRQGKVFVVNRVAKHVTPSVVTKRFPVATQKKVLAKALPMVTKGNIPVVTENKVVEKVVPSVTEGNVSVVTTEKVAEQAAPSATTEIVSVPKEQEKVSGVTEENVENLIPSVTEGKMPVVPQQEIVEKVAPSATEIVTVPKEQEQVPVVTEEKVVEEIAPSVAEEKVPVVTNQTVVEKITPTTTEEKVVTQRELAENVAPSVNENVVSIPKGEEIVVETIAPAVKAITTE